MNADSGWINSQLLLEWLQHFVKAVGAADSDGKRVILFLDNHSTR